VNNAADDRTHSDNDSPNSTLGGESSATDLNVAAPQIRHVNFPYSEEKTLLHVSEPMLHALRRIPDVC
jgi:hypothetical protein